MENTTKALLMAAGVLIGVLILTAFIWVFRKGGQMLETVDNKKSTEAIEEYNSKLIIYNRENNNIFDVITACNMAFDINTQNMFDITNGLTINIHIDGTSYILSRGDKTIEKGKIGSEKLTDLIRKEMGNRIINGENTMTTLSTIEKRTVGTEEFQEYIYTFTGNISYDESSGKINQINFILNP